MRLPAQSSTLAIVGAALVIGVVLGWAIKPQDRPKPPPEVLTDAVESLEDVERRSGAVVEILNDMAAGRISSDADALRSLRDSMQELTETVGDVKSQLRLLTGR